MQSTISDALWLLLVGFGAGFLCGMLFFAESILKDHFE